MEDFEFEVGQKVVFVESDYPIEGLNIGDTGVICKRHWRDEKGECYGVISDIRGDNRIDVGNGWTFFGHELKALEVV